MKYIIPITSFVLYFIIFSIFVTTVVPSIRIGYGPDVNVWHIAILLLSILHFRKIADCIIQNKPYLFFISYILISALIEAAFSHTNVDLITVIRRFGLFFCSFSVFIMIRIFADHPKAKYQFDRFLLFIICITTVFGFYQLIAREFNLPFAHFVEQSYRRRLFFTQMTSFFMEPRFYGTFLICCLYLLLYHYTYRIKKTLLLFIFASLIFTMSITSYIAVFIIAVVYFFQFKIVKKLQTIKISYNFRKILLLILIFISILFPSYHFKVHELAIARVGLAIEAVNSVSFEEHWRRTVENPLSHLKQHYQGDLLYRQYSFYISTFGEISFIIKVLKESPLFGFGIGYDKIQIQRTMGLNAFTEFMVRWGLMGTILFIFVCFHKKPDIRPKNKLSFIVMFLLFCSSHGSIAEPFFWFCLSLIGVNQNFLSVSEKGKSYRTDHTYFSGHAQKRQNLFSPEISGLRLSPE